MAANFLLATFFVLAVYIWRPIYKPPYETKADAKLSKQQIKLVEEFEIKMRTQSVGFLCLFTFLAITLISEQGQRPDVTILQWFGLRIDYNVIVATFSALILNSVLFAGEIYQLAKGMAKISYTFDILAAKNLIAAPLFEEFIYRTCLINFCIESDALTAMQAVFVMPFFFAISHLHHAIAEYRQYGLKKRQMILKTLFRLAYTNIFGIYSGLVYIKTGSIWPAFALHSQCNFFGFPSFSNFFDREYTIPDKVIAGALYIIGTILFFIYFDSTFSGYQPWFAEKN